MLELFGKAYQQPKSLFISHGAPDLMIGDSAAKKFLVELGKSLHKPKAIVMVSAHWSRQELSLLGRRGADIDFDFYGFPNEIYNIRYSVNKSDDLMSSIEDRLMKMGRDVGIVHHKEMDHGAWIPLYLMDPESNIPVIQLSLVTSEGADYHYQLGKALAELSDENILVIGSGCSVHNLSAMQPHGADPQDWALDFDRWLNDSLVSSDIESTLSLFDVAPNAYMAHPSPEHIMPLFVALGAAGESAKAERIHESYCYGNLGMSSFSFF